MTKYTFTNIEEDGTIVTLGGNKEQIDDVVEDFKAFLLGCTFSPELVAQIYRHDEEENYGN